MAFRTLTTIAALTAITPRCFTSATGFSLRSRSAAFTRHLLIAFRHRGSPRQTHPALFVHTQALDHYLIAEFDDIFRLLDAEIGQLADVHQAVAARKELHERAEILNRDHFSTIDFADLGFRGHPRDRVARDLHAFF
jgi:hypothetical protein